MRSENKILTKLTPFWLTCNDGKFIPIPERVETIKRIFELAKDDAGKTKITKTLNQLNIPPFRKKRWGTSSVQRILRNRELIGEYQPHKMIGGKRVPDGEPISDYFPKVIDENLFYMVQYRKQSYVPIKGPSSNKINNLFTGILKCKYCSGTSYVYVDKGKNWQYLVCYNAKTGVGCRNDKYESIRYDIFEHTFFQFCRELQISSLLNESDGSLKEIEELTSQSITLNSKVEENRKKIKRLMLKFAETDDEEIQKNFNELLSQLNAETQQLSGRLKNVEYSLKQKKAFLNSSSTELEELQTYYDKVKNLSVTDIYKLRLRVRSAIRELVDHIDVSGRFGFQIWFRNGSMRYINNFINIKLSDQKIESSELRFDAGDWTSKEAMQKFKKLSSEEFICKVEQVKKERDE